MRLLHLREWAWLSPPFILLLVLGDRVKQVSAGFHTSSLSPVSYLKVEVTQVVFLAVRFVHALKVLSERVETDRRAVQLCPGLSRAHILTTQRRHECRDGRQNN